MIDCVVVVFFVVRSSWHWFFNLFYCYNDIQL